VNVDDYLPFDMHAFPHPNPSWGTVFKRDVLFAPMMLDGLSRSMAKSFRLSGSMTPESLTRMLPPDERRNFVLTRDELIMTVVDKGNVSWALSKHVLAASAAGDACPVDGRGFPMVRFAGELWRDHDGAIHFNTNSGTYMPSGRQLEATQQLASQVFQGVSIIPESAAS
jgi:hypothetical protein